MCQRKTKQANLGQTSNVVICCMANSLFIQEFSLDQKSEECLAAQVKCPSRTSVHSFGTPKHQYKNLLVPLLVPILHAGPWPNYQICCV